MEDQCREALIRRRWPKGFACPLCGGTRHGVIKTGTLYRCSTCRSQISLTA
ncbi:MAG: transposase [Desulfovibrio sp.]|nr:transposase [Desulfovibrio sp.]